MTTKDGETETVTATVKTKYSRMDTPITLKDIKGGEHGVIHATKKDDKLMAATVQVGMERTAGMLAMLVLF